MTAEAQERSTANFLTIQALRAVAALLVVLLHAFETWGERVDPAAPGEAWDNGASGSRHLFHHQRIRDKVAMVAFAAKTARIIWAMLVKGEHYCDRASAPAAAC